MPVKQVYDAAKDVATTTYDVGKAMVDKIGNPFKAAADAMQSMGGIPDYGKPIQIFEPPKK